MKEVAALRGRVGRRKGDQGVVTCQTSRAWYQMWHRRGPWGCHFCGKKIPKWENVVVHHADENKANNSKENLVAAHLSCHVKYHHKQRIINQLNQQRKGKRI